MLINPETLSNRLQRAIAQAPILIKEELEKSNLEKINIENLKQGKDSDGNDMPRYRNPDYAAEHLSTNPNNRGFWDLKLTGEYYRGIEAIVNEKEITFKQRFSNDKIDWLHERLKSRMFGNVALGITEDQFYDVQLKNKPKIKVRLENIINGTS